MCAGLALLVDVHYPEQPNARGVIFINGSGWHAPLSYDTDHLKDNPFAATYVNGLPPAGYTLFSINHRLAPVFRYPAALEDAQRAVRFVRHHANRFGIDPDHIGAIGISSGGHLASMLGVLEGKGDPEDTDAVNQESARVQCVVARAAPSELSRIDTGLARSVASFMGMTSSLGPRPAPKEEAAYRLASPVFHVSKESAPFLLVHGDADPVVPFEQSEIMHDALSQAGVPVKFLRIEGGLHTPRGGAPDPANYIHQVTDWLYQHLGTIGSQR